VQDRLKGGGPRQDPVYPWIQLPCCQPCNRALIKSFELPLRPAVEALFDLRALSAQEAADTGLWLLKTVLLLHHPEATSRRPGDPAPWEDCGQGLFSCLSDGGDPPEDLGLWVHGRDAAREGQVPLPLPTIEGDRVHACRAAGVGLGEHLGFSLVHHPPGRLLLPGPAEAASHRLWPPSGALDPAALLRVGPWPLAFEPGWHMSTGGVPVDRAALPPLARDLDPTAIAQVVHARL